jgi:hypothetical protein
MSGRKFFALKGKDYDMDCPDPNCVGWLEFFSSVEDVTRPQFVRCSNFRKNDTGSCKLGIIFSKRDGICMACNKAVIKVRRTQFATYHFLFFYVFKGTLIATKSYGNWFLVSCIASAPESCILERCLRCDLPIKENSPTEQAKCGNRDGFIHATCSGKRKLAEGL